MFLEKTGKIFFSQIRPLLFFFTIGLPLIGVTLYLSFEHTRLQELETRFMNAVKKEKIALGRKERKERLLDRYSEAHPYFMNQNIESFSLLEKEKTKLSRLLTHPAFPNHPLLKNRLAFLNENRLTFNEENIHLSSSVKESDEHLRSSVQMDETDLQIILSLVEGLPIGNQIPPTQSPQLIIKDFRLKKLETPLQTEVFEVEMDLLKREFIKS